MTESSDPAAGGPAAQPPRANYGSRAGLLYGLSAYTIWGFIPIYFKAMAQVQPMIVLCHRILWSALFLGLIVLIRGDWQPVRQLFGSRRNLAFLAVGAVLIALNWLLFIYAVTSRQLLQASLGYFINPLLSVALGMIFLHERLRGWQWLAVAIAVAAVANLAWQGAGFPWLAVSLAGSFGFYGLVRKKLDASSLHGLLVETTLLVPLAVVLLAWLPTGKLPPVTWGLLSLAGIVTAVPLLCFGAALRRLKLSTMGFLQYVGPTLQFLVAVCLFREPLDLTRLGSFALCWLAIVVYIIDSVLHQQAQALADEPE